MKNIVFALVFSALLLPAAGAAEAPKNGKTGAAKTSKNAKGASKSPKKAKAPAARAHAARAAALPPVSDDPSHLEVKSTSALVIEPIEGRTLFAKNIDVVVPIASITKLMAAMVVLDAGLNLHEQIAISNEDVDLVKHTRSRLRIGTVLERDELLRLALMASENRAAAALARAYPGGSRAFVAAMNQKAAGLGMTRTWFVDSTGLSSDNVSTAYDLAKMVVEAYRYPLIQEYSTLSSHAVRTESGRVLSFGNSNGLVRDETWRIDVSKTGYISEAGRCLVMQARIAAKPVVIVLLDSWGKYTRIGDANRIKRWVEGPLARNGAS